MDAETAFTGIEMRSEQLRAGPLHQHDHEASGEHLRHRRDLGRLWKRERNGLVLLHLVGEAVGQPDLERRLHVAPPCPPPILPAFSSPGSRYSVPSHGERKSKFRNSWLSRTGS